MSDGAKAVIAVVVVGGLLYWYYMSSAPGVANVPNGAGSGASPDNTTSGTTLGQAVGGGGVSSSAPSPAFGPAPGPNTVGNLFGIKPNVPQVTNAKPISNINTFVTNLLKRSPSLAGTDVLTANPTTGYLLAAPTGAGAAYHTVGSGSTGSGAAGTSSTGFTPAPGYHTAPTIPTKV